MKLNHTVASPVHALRGRRAAVAALALALAAGPALAPVATFAAESDDLSSQLAAAQQELADLTSELERAQAEVDTTAFELADTQDRIATLEAQVAETSEKLASAQEELSSQAAQTYKAGSVTLFDIILSSSSFDELASRLYYANKVADAESSQVENVRELQESLNAQQSELATREEELTGLLDQQTASADALSAAQSETSSYVNGLSSELQEALAAERAAAAAAAAQQQPATDTGATDNGNQGTADTTPVPETPSGGNNTQQQPSAPSGGGSTSNPSTPSGGGSGSGGSASSGNLSQSQRSTIVSTARSQLGCAYSWGACSPGVAFDCSGLTMYAYRAAGISLSHSSAAQYRTVKNAGNLKTNAGDLVAGDLVFYQSGGVVGHVAIYIGGGQVIHASDYSTGVITSSLYYSSGFCGGGSPV